MPPGTELLARWHLYPAVDLRDGPTGLALLVGHEVLTITAADLPMGRLLEALAGPGLAADDVATGAFGDPAQVSRLVGAMAAKGLVGSPWTAAGDPSDRQVPYYSLFEVDPVLAHRRISNARVAVIGAGGIGGSVAVDLVAAGIGGLVLADFDVVEISNLNRQHTYDRTDLGTPKVEALAQRLHETRPATTVETWHRRIGAADDLPVDGPLDVVVCAADAPPAIGAICIEIGRRHDAATAFAGVALGRGFVGPIVAPGGRQFAATDGHGDPTPYSFGPANQVIASILAGELIRYLATADNRLASTRLVVDTLRWTTTVDDLSEGAGR